MDDDRRLFGLVVGGMLPVALAMLLVPLREAVSSVNIALMMVIAVVVAAAIGSRLAAVVAAVMAAAAFDFFHTEPYLSLRIDAQDDVETAVILLVVGLVVATVAIGGRRARMSAEEQGEELRSIHRVAELVASGVPADLVVEAACSELTSLMSLRSCTFEQPAARSGVATLERGGAIGGVRRSYISTPHGLELPRDGVAIDVLDRGRTLGQLALVPTPGIGVPRHTRVAAIVIADLISGALGSRV